MSFEPLVPLVFALIAAMSAGFVQRRLSPRVATWTLTTVAAVAGAGVVAGLMAIVLSAVAAVPAIADRVG